MDFCLTLEMQDDLVDGIQDISIALPSALQTVAEIGRLPPEMLAAIFAHLSKQELGSPGRGVSDFVQDLVSVTHVCRAWRQVATTSPELWTEITMTNPEAVEAFLGRSGAVPLNVDLRLGHNSRIDGDILKAVIPHTYRFRQLSVFTRRGLVEIESMPLMEPAPLLERLVIRHPLGNRTVLLFEDHAPRLRELVLYSKGLWLQNQLGNLTSLHITLSHVGRTRSDFLSFFDMLRRCPVLEEMFISWGGWGTQLEPPQLPTVPLPHLRKLLLHSFCVGNIKSLLHAFDLKTNGIAIHLSDVYPSREEGVATDIQTMFPSDNSGQPSLAASTKLELIFHTRPRTIITHAIGPGFSMRIDLRVDNFTPLDDANYTFHDIFPSVKELWVRGSSRVYLNLCGIKNFTALEKLVIVGRGSKMARSFRQALSPGPLGDIPCPLLSAIDCYGDASEMREIFLLLRTRSNAGSQLERMRVPSCFIPLPADIASCVRDVGSLDIPPRTLHMYAMELPAICFAEREHRWWKPWKSRLT